MKKMFCILLCLAAMLTFGACSEEEVTTMVTTNPSSNVKGTMTKAERPNWVRVDNITPSSMSIFVDQEGMPTSVTTDDMLAAFVNNECRGVAKPIDAGGYYRFNLSVESTDADESATSIPVELRYYSADKKGVYTAIPFEFKDGVILGTTGKGKGYVPAWK